MPSAEKGSLWVQPVLGGRSGAHAWLVESEMPTRHSVVLKRQLDRQSGVRSRAGLEVQIWEALVYECHLMP